MSVDRVIESVSLHLLELGYGNRVAPYEWSAGTDTRFPTILVEISTASATGWGEGGLLWGDPLVQEQALLDIWLQSTSRCLLGRPIVEFRELGAQITSGPLPDADGFPGGPQWRSSRSGPLTWEPAAVAAESALWDLFAREANVPLRALFGDGSRSAIRIAPAIGRLDPAAAATLAAMLVADGFGVLKLKGGRGVDIDIDIVEQVRRAVGADTLLRLDPNGSYDPVSASRLATAIRGSGLEYLEQPCPPMSLRRLGEFRRMAGLPIALDESVLRPASVIDLHDAGAADVILVEPHQVGGIAQLVDTVAAAAACGFPVGVHAAYATGVRTATVAHLAAASSAISCAPDTLYHDLTEDVLSTRLVIEDGTLLVPEGAGLGIEVDRERLEAQTVSSFSHSLHAGFASD